MRNPFAKEPTVLDTLLRLTDFFVEVCFAFIVVDEAVKRVTQNETMNRMRKARHAN